MVDELGKEIAIEAAKAVAVEGYKDALQPTFKAAGSIFALPFQAIDAALSKPKLWVAEKCYNYERTRQLLAQKMKYTPEDEIVPPENYVAVPALQQIAYCFDSDELRDMYANLLANSMNKVVKNGVHPGFVDIIKQLSPDEAKILKYISVHITIPTITLRYENDDGGGINIITDFSNVGEICGCENPIDITKYFDNLARLGLITRAGTLSTLCDETQYNPLINHKWIMSYATTEKANARGFEKYNFSKSYIKLNAYGKSFCSICLEPPTTIILKSQESGN